MKFSIVSQYQKLRGGYYTSSDIASVIIEKLVDAPNKNILEPSFGGGSFIIEAIKRKISLGENINNIKNSITGIELDSNEYNKLISFIKDNYSKKFSNLFCDDFFSWFDKLNNHFDIIVGNPPFIRYQSFPEPSRTKALRHALIEGVKLSKLSNIWVPFLILSASLLKENGHLGMVVPAELLQVSYAGPLREYLLYSFENIILFTCNELLFMEAEQETIILLAFNKKANNALGNIEIIKSNTKNELINSIKNYKYKCRKNILLQSREKWTKYFLNKEEILFIQSLNNNDRVIQFKKYFDVDVGVVTGKNNYFVIDKYVAKEFNLYDYIRPIICRSYQIKDEIFNNNDWDELWKNGERVGLLDFNNLNGYIPKNVQKYFDYGVSNNVNNGYKCSTRKEWYKVPSIWIPDAFMFRQIHDFPHFVVNNAQAISTDTIHRVRQNTNNEFNQVLFYTYLTAATAEIEGRSYGGGVLELEPTEAERLLIPNPEYINLKELNYSVSRKENGKFLYENSYYILKKFLNFSNNEIFILENIYKKLFFRRTNRKKPNHAVVNLYNDPNIFPQ
jgi:adenine-specific DNA methylase